MDKRTTDIVCYCTWVGLLIAVLAGNREASRFHLNQSLVLGIFGLLGVIPCVGWVWAVFVAVWWCMGLTGAIRGVELRVIRLLSRDGIFLVLSSFKCFIVVHRALAEALPIIG